MTERADLGIGASEQHIITDITDRRRSTIGSISLFNSESVYPQRESDSVAKDMMGKIQGERTIDGQSLTVAYSWTRGCELVQIAQVSRSQVHPKLTEVHMCLYRVTNHNLTFHQIRVSQTIQRR
eukprot:989636-Pelagomonas_calceolata.AAC.1